jgi:hypothetical protein
VGAPGGISGNFQSRVRTISLQTAVLPVAVPSGPSRRRTRRGRRKEKKKKKKKNRWRVW